MIGHRFALLLALAASACCPRPWPKELARLPDAGALLSAAKERRTPLSSLSGSAKVDSFGPKGRVRGRIVFTVERAGRLRFEAISPFEQPISTLTCDGPRFALFEFGKNRIIRGSATPENVSRLLPIRMWPKEIAAVLLGDAPVLEHDAIDLRVEKCETHYVLAIRGKEAGTRQEIVVDGRSLATLRSRVWSQGDLLYDLQFEDFAATAGVIRPRKIRFRAPRDKVDILVMYGNDLVANDKYDDDVFQIETPPGATVEELS